MLILALNDFKKAFRQYPVWLHLGLVEVKQRYRRSVLGPWWISLSMLIFIVMMGLVFSRLFHQQLDQYVPFFTAGFLFWTFISTSILEGTEIFRSNSGYIKQINLPFSLYVFKHLVRQTIFLMHNFVVYLLVCAYFQFNPGWTALWGIPGFVLLSVNVYWISFILAIVCTRFRDMAPLINSCVQIAFFITPISWMPKLLENNPYILKLNPFVYLLDIVRSPLLGQMPSLSSWIVCGIMGFLGCALSSLAFARVRARITFWVD